MTPEVKSRIEDELKRFATELNLSDSQKAQLRTALERAEDKLGEIREKTPIGKVRESIREQLTKFLTPQQLTKWDAEMAKAATFLGHSTKP
jgi:phage shock protein A